MKRGGDALSAQGFTIVETLIVLAVTGTLFLSAVALIDGKQAKTNFQVGIRTIQQQFQKIINQTVSGYYPNNSNFSCNVRPAPPLQIMSGSPTGQGTNQDCIFVGNTLVVGGTNHTDTYAVYPLAGRRAVNGRDVKTPQEAFITAVATSAANPTAPTVNSVSIPNGFTYAKARRADSTVWTTGPFATAFLSSLGNFQGNATNTSGSQQLNVATYSFWDPAKSDADNINYEATRPSPYPMATSGVQYCFNSGTTNQSVVITISAGLDVTTSIKNGAGCP